MARESKTKYALLGILSQCEMSGYEIKKFIENSLGFFWNESFGQIYPALKSMEEEGLISSTWIDSEESKSKILYQITKKGFNELKSWLEGSTAKHVVRNELLLKLFFARNMDKSILIEQLKQTKEEYVTELNTYHAIRKGILKDHKDHPDRKYWLFTLEYGIDSVNMSLKWLEKVIKQIEKD